MLAHNVYFTLQDDSESVVEEFISACFKFLAGHDGIVFFAVGRRQADFQREVNDVAFDVALNIVFQDCVAHEDYQTAPRHLEFIEIYKSNWKNVRVFDSLPSNL
jgi:hypothetical protein